MRALDQRFLRIRRSFGWTRTARLTLLVTIGLCVYGVVFGDYGFMRIVELRQERAYLEKQIDLWTMKLKLLETRKDRLENDEFLIEKLIRERLGYYKPGELIFLFPEPDSSQEDLSLIPGVSPETDW